MPAIYAAMRSGLLVSDPSTDGEDSVRLDDAELECVTAHPAVPDRVFVGTFDAGLRRSTDGGATFDRVGDDTIDPDAVTAVAIDPTDPDEVWAGTEPSRIYRSADGGQTWSHRDGLTDVPSADQWSFPPRPHTHHVRWIEVDPADPAHLYVGIEAGALVQTWDRGVTWEDREPGSRRDNHTLAAHADAPGRAWSAAGDGYAETSDGGRTWEPHHEGLEHTYCWGLALDPGDPRTVLVSAASGANAAHRRGESYLYRKQGDAPWRRIGGERTGIPTGNGVHRYVLQRGREAGEVYALNEHGLFRTRDAGDSWTRIDGAWPGRFESETARGLAVV